MLIAHSIPELRAALVGRFSAALGELTVPYARPQESGHRSDLRSLTLRSGAEDRLRFDAIPDAAGRLSAAPDAAGSAPASVRPGEPLRVVS